MLQSYVGAFRSPVIRVSAFAIFFMGFAGAAVTPFASLIAIRELGFTDAAYSLLIFLSAVVNVGASIFAGILCDRLGEFRRPMVIVSIFGVIGYGIVYALPSAAILAFAVLLPIPIFGSINSLLFANVRANSSTLPESDRSAVNGAVRAMISLSWVLVPGLVGFMFSGRDSMLPAFLVSAFGALACLLLVGLFLPRGRTPPPADPAHALMASLKILSAPKILIRVLAVSLVSSMLFVNASVLPLIVTGRASGTPTDVGTVIGIVAALEIVFIIGWSMVERRLTLLFSFVIGAAIYGVYLLALGMVTSTTQVYALSLVSGIGAAACISFPITYLQNLIHDRPGLGSSLIAVNVFLGGGLASLIFAAGTAISSYGGTSILSAAVGICGAGVLLVLDGRKATVPAEAS